MDQKLTVALFFSGLKLVTASLSSPFDQEIYGRNIGMLSRFFTLAFLSVERSVLGLVVKA